jgi:hypothetical protein
MQEKTWPVLPYREGPLDGGLVVGDVADRRKDSASLPFRLLALLGLARLLLVLRSLSLKAFGLLDLTDLTGALSDLPE